jgi:hypothetical protein
MSYEQKYLKYKNKYLKLKMQLAGSDFSTLQYNVDSSGTIINSHVNKLQSRHEIDTYDHNNFFGVLFARKICSGYDYNQFTEILDRYKIQKDEPFVEHLLSTIVVINKTTLKTVTNYAELTALYTANSAEKGFFYILYFADDKSRETYLLLSQNESIFVPDLLLNMYQTLGSLYSIESYDNRTFLFHILHGILFTYDIKDIYGYLYHFNDNIQNYNKQFNENIPLIIINKDIFFEKLNIIISLILEVKSSVLEDYAQMISETNLKNGINNFLPTQFKGNTYIRIKNYELFEKIASRKTYYDDQGKKKQIK